MTRRPYSRSSGTTVRLGSRVMGHVSGRRSKGLGRTLTGASSPLLCLLLLLSGLAACADDPSSPSVTIRPAELRIDILVTHATEDRLRLLLGVRAVLDRGLRSDGTPHPYAGDTLWVMGEPVVRVAADSFGGRFQPPESMIREDIVVRAPRLAGLGPPPEIRWPLAYRMGPDTTLVEQGERPVVRLAVPGRGGTNGLFYERWWIELPEPGTVTKGGGYWTFVAASGEGAPPERFPFPDQAFPLFEIGEGYVGYRVRRSSDAPASGRYRIDPTITVALFFVHVTEPELLPR